MIYFRGTFLCGARPRICSAVMVCVCLRSIPISSIILYRMTCILSRNKSCPPFSFLRQLFFNDCFQRANFVLRATPNLFRRDGLVRCHCVLHTYPCIFTGAQWVPPTFRVSSSLFFDYAFALVEISDSMSTWLDPLILPLGCHTALRPPSVIVLFPPCISL